MAMHTDLPIHKVAFDLLSLAADVTRNIPRDFKAGLGAKVRDECIEVMVLIARANIAQDKRPQQHRRAAAEQDHHRVHRQAPEEDAVTYDPKRQLGSEPSPEVTDHA